MINICSIELILSREQWDKIDLNLNMFHSMRTKKKLWPPLSISVYTKQVKRSTWRTRLFADSTTDCLTVDRKEPTGRLKALGLRLSTINVTSNCVYT